ncbi:MAG: IS21-like element helper ATPase IstB [Planctomycetales bacterium]|nr:IS21-like element helper ATPase IstB [Planctomycetales bacterium]
MRIEQTRKLLSAGILPAPAPTQDVDALRQRLDALRLVFAAEALSDLLSQAVKQQWNSATFLDALLRLELERQEERRIAQALRISHLPTGPTISNFDFAFQPSVSRSQIETLATCQWIRDCQGLLLQGPPGVGKTHLAVGLGMRAIEGGFSVCFVQMDEFVHQLKKDAEVSPARMKHKKYMASSLLIIDEFGYEPLDRATANAFFRVVNHRYQRGAMAITTNKGIASWPEVFAGDEVLAGAILDRLLHSAVVLNIQGRSYRLRELEAQLGEVRTSLRAASSPSEDGAPPKTIAKCADSNPKSSIPSSED